MIREYHRPKTIEEALTLIAEPGVVPLGGGIQLSQPGARPAAVVDLQALGLNKIHKVGNNLEIGAAVTLQALLESEHCPTDLKQALKLEAPLNIRNAATVAGALAACDGRSPFAAAMLALDAQVSLQPGEETAGLGNILPLRQEALAGKLITTVTIPLNAAFAYRQVARTPMDKPILCAAMTLWSSKRTRLVLGGWGASPSLAMDGREPGGYAQAARNAAQESGDQWASAEYRRETAEILSRRCFTRISKELP
ncbi:MAG: FAD binding domain-containing protein [Anaerolineales bacterium]|nr:FAD binding domain-containing protein [Anaerolineales bacterium]